MRDTLQKTIGVNERMSLNDPRWGRDPRDSEEEKKENARSDENEDRREDERADEGKPRDERRDRVEGVNQDIDALWRTVMDFMKDKKDRGETKRPGADAFKNRDDFTEFRPVEEEEAPREERPREERRDERKPRSPFDGLDPFARRAGGSGGNRGGRRGMNFSLPFVLGVALIGWAATGFYIVPEGQTGIVTTFGRYSDATMPGFHWRFPAPVQNMQLVDVSSVRTTNIGVVQRTNRTSEALMLTDDENIVDVQFAVQYRIKSGEGAKDYLFNTRNPDVSVTQAAESAMREVVGSKSMDSVLFESKAEIAEDVRKLMQAMLDRYGTGIEVMSVAIQNAQPPEPVQAAFNDAVKAGQDRERSINLGEAYMNAVIPKAEGTASRLKEEAAAYKARVVETARGDADRFASVFEEYRKAPEVTRDRLYIDAMRDVYRNVTKVVVDAKGGNNLLYLPLDKIVSQTKSQAQTEAAGAVLEPAPAAAEPAPAASGTSSSDARPRDLIRNRGR